MHQYTKTNVNCNSGALVAIASCCFVAKSNLYPFVKCRQSCLKIISPGDREASMLAKQKEEMGAPLTKREKQAKNGIENITNKDSFKNDQ